MVTLQTAAEPILLAQADPSGGPGAFLPLVFLVVVFWFLIMRPQQRKMKEHRALLAALDQGDRVVAAGGIVGTIRRIDDEIVQLQVADNVVIRVDRGTISKKLEA